MTNLHDNIEVISRGWMDKSLFVRRIQESRVIGKDPDDRNITLFLDNCSGHRLLDPVLEELNNTSISTFMVS